MPAAPLAGLNIPVVAWRPMFPWRVRSKVPAVPVLIVVPCRRT